MRSFTIGQLEIDIRAPERVLGADFDRPSPGAIADSFLVRARYQGQPVDFWPNQPKADRFEEHFSFVTQESIPFYSDTGVLLETKRGAGYRSAFWRVVLRRVVKALLASQQGITIGQVDEARISAAPLALRRLARAVFVEPVNMRAQLDETAFAALTDEPMRLVRRLRRGTTATIDCDFDSFASSDGTQDEVGTTVSVAIVGGVTRRPQWRFPLASITASPTVSDSDFQALEAGAALETNETLNVNGYNPDGDDPDVDSAANKYAKSVGGTTYITNTTAFSNVASTSVSVDLGVTADADIQANVDVADRFTISMAPTGANWSNDVASFEAIEGAGTDPATLTVVYTSGSPVDGTMAATLTKATASLTGSQAQSGTIAATLARTLFNASGVMEPSGVIAATMQKLLFNASGAQAEFVGGIISALQPATFAGEGAHSQSGILSSELQQPIFSGSGLQAQAGVLSATLTKLLFNASGSTSVQGTLAATLQKLIFSGTAGQIIARLFALPASSFPVQVPLDSEVAVSAIIRDLEGNLTDPVSITLQIHDSKSISGITTLTYGVDADLVRDGTGLYHALILGDRVGAWFYRWEMDDVAVEGNWEVEPSILV